jgi:ribose transport system substrate-binding protein
MMRYFPLVLLLLLVCAGCSQNSKHKPVVGVVPKGANHIFWQSVHAGAIKAAQEFDLEVEWNAPTTEVDSSRQIEIVESMVNRKLAGIALAPVDSDALVSAVNRAASAAIPVAIFDSDINTKNRITFVATNNREGGRMAAGKLAELLKEQGKVAIIGFMPGSASTMEREQGFEEEMKKNHPKIQIVQMAYGMASQAKSLAATENIMTAHPDLTGLFADNESSTMGAVLALKARADGKVKMVGFDSSEQLVDDLRHRIMEALVVQNPFKMGYESTRAIGMKLRGESVPAYIDSGATLVTWADIEKPDILALLFPDIKSYLEPPARR